MPFCLLCHWSSSTLSWNRPPKINVAHNHGFSIVGDDWTAPTTLQFPTKRVEESSS